MFKTLTKTRWIIPQNYQQQINELRNSDPAFASYSDDTLMFLLQRGINTRTKLQMILDTDLTHQHDSSLMTDSIKFVDTLNKLVMDKWDSTGQPLNIVIYGDYDGDGITATTVMLKSLNAVYLGRVNLNYFINNRFRLGYGMNPQGIHELVQKFPDTELIITVDNGIVAFDGIKEARKLGINVLVTDHHKPNADGLKVDALAIVDPHQKGDKYPFKDICGCVVAWKMMQLLAYRVYPDRPELFKYIFNLVDLCGISTISDVMPLIDENRLFVKHFLAECNKRHDEAPYYGSNLGVRYLLQEISDHHHQNAPYDEETIKFYIAPMINSSARVTGDSDIPMTILNSNDPKVVSQACDQLEQINEQRKNTSSNVIHKINEKHLVDTSKKFLLYVDEGIGDGIIGLVSGKLTEKYNRPSIVLTHDVVNGKDIYKGSGRSIEGFDITDMLVQISKQYERDTHSDKKLIAQFGGHVGACGLTVAAEQLETFEKYVWQFAEQHLAPELMQKKVKVDVVFTPESHPYAFAKEVEQFKPFGEGFEAPIIAYHNFKVDQVQILGSKLPLEQRVHMKFSTPNANVLFWSGRKTFDTLIGQDYNPNYNQWGKGRPTPELTLDLVGSIVPSDYQFDDRPVITVLDDNFAIRTPEPKYPNF